MRPESTLTLLEHIREAAEFILEQTQGVTFAAYCSDRNRRAIVERYFITVGEAMSRIAREDPATASEIEPAPRIIAFRNRVVHGYDKLDNTIVWAIIEKELPGLLETVQSLLRTADGDGP